MALICLNELSNYNNGELVYKWFDLDDHQCASEFWGAVNDWLKTCTNPYGEKCEEWNLADVDGIPEEFYGEYSFDAVRFFEYKDLLAEVDEAKLDAYRDLFGTFPESASEVNERFFKSTDCLEDSRGLYIEVGCELVNDSGLLSEVPEEIARYFDYEKYGRDHYRNRMGMSNGLIFWTE